MKILTIEEVRKFLNDFEICEILSATLINEVAEETIEKYSDDRGLYIATVGGEPFSNLNWRYYRNKFKKSEPKRLSLLSWRIDDFSGLGEFKTLEGFKLDGRCAGNHLDSLKLSRDKMTALLKELSQLPKLNYVSIRAIFSERIIHNDSPYDLFSKLEKDLRKKFAQVVKTSEEFSFSEKIGH